MRWPLPVLLVLSAALPAYSAGRPMTVHDLLATKSVSDPQVSPDGKSVVYVVGELDPGSGKTNSDLWMVAVGGGEPKRLTTAPGAENHPRWSPDGRQIAFTSDRGGSTQVWLLPIDGGEARQLTRLPMGVSGPIWSPKGDRLAFSAEVFPGKTPEETAKLDREKAEAKSKARIYDRLMIRHWASWDEGKRSHLFVADASTGAAKDLTPDLEVNVPPAPFGGSADFAFSADGKMLAFTAEPASKPALSTNSDVWVVPVEGGEPENLTKSNEGADAQPAYSPDGKYLAYLSQARAGFEADQWVLKVRNVETGETTPLTEELDRPILSYAWEGKPGSSSRSLLAVIDHKGTEPIIRFHFGDRDGKVVAHFHDDLDPLIVVGDGVNTAVQPVPGGEAVVYLHAASDRPTEVYQARVVDAHAPKQESSDLKALTRHNAPLLSELDLSRAEAFTFKGADGDDVSGWLVRPPGFDKSKKYPVLFLIHGGPQGSWHDEWHGRWNFPLFAAPGYAVVAINARGSTGYGQTFTDQISKDWAGRVYEDLMKGLDHALQTYPFLDRTRMAAAGGSYGGYMVNWIAGHSGRFKALISHAGVFDLSSEYLTTEELWFPEWEFGGPPWKNPDLYRDQSPSTFAADFKTPTLVIHGALDFRVPDAQGLGMFTALQRQGVPSRYLFFPDEGHWIAKPANRVVWWGEMHAWLAKYLK